jgi:hypothetical protein
LSQKRVVQENEKILSQVVDETIMARYTAPLAIFGQVAELQ